jgi:hypothetical protein
MNLATELLGKPWRTVVSEVNVAEGGTPLAEKIQNESVEALKEIRDFLATLLRVVSIQVGADKSLTERVRLLKLAGSTTGRSPRSSTQR